MTRDDEFIGQLRDYFDEYEGLTPLPDAVRDAIRAELPTTKQIGPISALMRTLNMTTNIPTTARYGLVAAAIVAAVLLGVTLFGGGPNVGGGPEATPTPIPTRNPNAYLITNDDGVRVTQTMPSGWTRNGWYVNNGGNVSTNLTAIQIWAVGNSYTDPCNWDETTLDPRLGPTVDDLATALENQLTREATTSDVTLDGYTGRLVKMTVPADAVFADCDERQFRSWVGPGGPDDARYHQGPGQHDDVYILDVDGLRLVIDALYYQASSAADRAELQQMLDTIQIEPPA